MATRHSAERQVSISPAVVSVHNKCYKAKLLDPNEYLQVVQLKLEARAYFEYFGKSLLLVNTSNLSPLVGKVRNCL